ncbi:MAG: MFS transporter [Desulfobacteraceae bacterium]|nr:MAG: MFS transporter [Desulfobacteraceae bacterium]
MNTHNNKSQHPILKTLRHSIFLVSFPFGIIAFILPIYSKNLGASAFEIGLLFFVFLIVPTVVRPFIGPFLDRWGRRPFLLIGLFGYVLAMIVFCFSNSIPLLGMARFLQGLGQALFWIAANTIVADLASATGRGFNFGLIDEAVNRGAIIGTFLGISMIFAFQSLHVSWRQIWFWLFILYTLPAFLSLGTAWRGIPETRPHAATSVKMRIPLSGQLMTLLVIVFLSGISTFMIWPMLMIFLQDILKAQFNQIALAYVPAALIGAFLPSRMGRLTDRYGRKKMIIAGLLSSALSSAVVPQLQSLLPLSILWAIQSLAAAAANPAELALLADIAGEDVRGTVYGFFTFSFFLGGALGAGAGGWLYDHTGFAVPFYLNTFFMIIGCFLVHFILRETMKPVPKNT